MLPLLLLHWLLSFKRQFRLVLFPPPLASRPSTSTKQYHQLMILLHWPLCVVLMAPLPLLRRHLCRCCASVITLSFRWHCCLPCAGVVAIVAMALPHCCTGIVNMPVGPLFGGIALAPLDLSFHTQAIDNSSHVIWIDEESLLFYKKSKAH
jgi:hypothetical protein